MTQPPVTGSQTPEPDDGELLRRHCAGDANAFADLVVRHRDRLWRVARRILDNDEDAADAVQDALLSAFRAAATFRADAAVTTWLHRITVNSCLDLARRRGARAVVPLTETAEQADPNATARLEQREIAREVLAALRRLPPEQAAAVVLVDVEGYPVHEAAIILQVAEGTVKSRCARARARLAASLSDLRNPSPPPAVEPGRTDPADPTAPGTSEPALPDRDRGEQEWT